MSKERPDNRLEYQASGVIHDAIDRMNSTKWICLIASPFTNDTRRCGDCDGDEWHCAVMVRCGSRIYIFDNDFDPYSCLYHHKQDKKTTSPQLETNSGMRNVYYMLRLIDACIAEIWITGCAGGIGLDCLPQSAKFIENVLAGRAGIVEGRPRLKNLARYLWTPIQWVGSDSEISDGVLAQA